jgi:WhiB family redox-sensing transcriptional regulator
MSQPFHSQQFRVIPYEEWMNEGSCRFYPQALFFPPDGHHTLSEAAREICNFCPVQLTCLEYALTHRLDDGIWGGTTGRERKRIIARRVRLRLALPA